MRRSPVGSRGVALVLVLWVSVLLTVVASSFIVERRIVRVVGYVASAEGFTGQPRVVNGASELLGKAQIFF